MVAVASCCGIAFIEVSTGKKIGKTCWIGDGGLLYTRTLKCFLPFMSSLNELLLVPLKAETSFETENEADDLCKFIQTQVHTLVLFYVHLIF